MVRDFEIEDSRAGAVSAKPAGQRIPILFIVHSLGYGGMERQVAVLASGLDPERYELHVATVAGGFRADDLSRRGVTVIPIPIRSFWDPGPWALSGFLAGYIRKHGIRLVHLFDAGLSLVTAMAVKRCRGVRLLSSQRFHMELVKPQHRYLLLAAHWSSDAIVANCEELRTYLHEAYGYTRGKVEVCYNGVDTAAFNPQGRNRSGVEGGIVIGSVGLLRPEKNYSQLLRAFARVRAGAPDASFVLMGSGPEEAGLRALAASLGVANACRFLPSDPDVAGLLRGIDIFVSSSLTEGLPNAVMEAMACGCSVVATRVGGCPELITHGEQGFLTAPGNEDELVEKLEILARQPGLREQMGAAAADRMAERFSIAQSVAQMDAIYERFLGSPRSG